MPRPTIEQVRGLGDVGTTYQWNLNFLDFPAALNGGVIPSKEDLNLRLISTTLPKKGNTDQEINVRGQRTYQSGQADYGGHEFTLVFYETVDNIVSNFLLAWEETCVQTLTGAHGSKVDSECAIEIERLNRQDIPIWSYILIGCKLKDYTETDLSGEDDTLKPSMILKYDYFKKQAI
jgi:hypothetical protein